MRIFIVTAITLLLTVSFNALPSNSIDGVVLWKTKVMVESGIQNAYLEWTGSDDIQWSHLQYRISGSGSWKSVKLGVGKSKQKVTSLSQGKKFEFRLKGIGLAGKKVHSNSAYCATSYIVIQNGQSVEQKVHYARLPKNGVNYNDNVHDNQLAFRYHNSERDVEMLQAYLYSDKHELISGFVLGMRYGENQYVMNLEDYDIDWKLNKFYSLETIDEYKRKGILHFKLIENKNEVKANISANPVSVDCDVPAGNVVDYLGEVKGGNAPYHISWKVTVDAFGQNLLYKPEEAMLDSTAVVPQIRVEKPLGYYVSLWVRDACGSEDVQIAHVKCEQGKKDEAYINFELLDRPDINKNQLKNTK
ncbi:hypothetical protein HNQ88_003538 [Aureibacter tunicatorum]|uniref:Fibronectin type-III domain-containing protein n=2 Tax=Aureibacter tunicatorum TaxID=866807 RepID=A0AAE3XQ16_9BACT|nr:hypothetical protein [Aureibacter tunicatorum]